MSVSSISGSLTKPELGRYDLESLKTGSSQAADVLKGMSGAMPTKAAPGPDRVSISEEGRKALADNGGRDLSAKMAGLGRKEKEGGPGKAAEDDEREKNQIPGAPENEDDKTREGQAPGGSGGQDPEQGRDNLEQRLAKLNKEAGELKEEIDELKKQADTEEAQQEIQSKESEKSMLEAQIKLLTMQLQNLERGGGGGEKA